jgi:hypothetical protein
MAFMTSFERSPEQREKQVKRPDLIILAALVLGIAIGVGLLWIWDGWAAN